MSEATVADTLCDPSVETPFPAQPVDPPTLSMTFRINDGPFAGQEGDKVQSRVIRERLMKEAERNIAIKVTELADDKDAFDVAGRGELQLGILIENMRREGFELTVSRPKVVLKTDAGHAARSSSRSRRSSSTSTRSTPASSCRSCPSARASCWRCAPRAAAASAWCSTCRRAGCSATRASCCPTRAARR